MIIQNEESLFKDSFAVAIGLEKPTIPLPEDYKENPEEFQVALESYKGAMSTFETKREEELSAKLEAGEIPPGVTGLIPDGSTKISWRYQGEIFEDDSQDILNNSIVVRNLQELGVDSIEALKYLFPGKTDEERASMLTGFPFRMVKETQQSFSTFVGLLGQLYQLPHPQVPNMPLASDPNLDITGFLYRSLQFLRKELSYSGRYKPNSSDYKPAELSAGDKLRAVRGERTRDEPSPNLPGLSDASAFAGATSGNGPGGVPTAGGPAGFGTGTGPDGQSMAAGVSGSKRKFEYKQPIPTPGITVGLRDTDAAGADGRQLGFSGQFGSPDLQSSSFNPAALSGLPGNLPGNPNLRRPRPQ